MSEASPAVERLEVRNVEREGDNLLWTSAKQNRPGLIELDKVIFALDLTKPEGASSPRFMICCLQEDFVELPKQPFRLLLLATDAVPPGFMDKYQLRQMPTHLCGSVDTIVSTKSGLGQSLAFYVNVLLPLWRLVGEAFRARRQPGRVFTTQHADSVQQIARQLEDDVKHQPPQTAATRTIILLSGDGGVAEMLNSRVGQGQDDMPAPTVALIPLGTGNALFHSLHKPVVPSDGGASILVAALRTLFTGVSARLPVFKASFTQGARIVKHGKPPGIADDETQLVREDVSVSSLYGVIVASYGFHASVVYESDTPEHRVHGDKRFGMVAEKLLSQPHAYRATVQIRRPSRSQGETDAQERHGYVLITMVSNLERKFAISPASQPLDGKLRLLRFGDVGADRTIEVMTKAYDGGKHVGLQWDDGHCVGYDEVQEVVVVSLDEDARWRKFCIDGTIVEVPRGGSMTVSKVQEPELLRVLVDGRVLEASKADA